MPAFNLFTSPHMNGPLESFETLLECRNVTIERILSPGNTRSEVFVQPQDEWVCLLQGEAELEMAGKKLHLGTGETLFIPAGTPHQVLHTSEDPSCIWLAVHIR